MRRFFLLSLTAMLSAASGALAAPGPQTAPGQAGGHCIAAMVNDVPITAFELSQNVRFALMSARVQDTAENRERIAQQVLRRMIDERLLLDDAKRSGIRVEQREIDERVQRIEQDNGMPPGGVKAMLGGAGIPLSVLTDQISAGIAWTKIVRRKAPGLEVSEPEVDQALQQIKTNVGKPENRVAEIFLAVDKPEQVDEALRTARRIIDQLKGGAPFPAMVQQFSSGASAARGGDLGWLLPGSLDPALDAAIAKLAVNQVSEPVRTQSGWHILKLLAQRQYGRSGNPGDMRLTLLELLLPLPSNYSPDEVERQKGVAQTVIGQAKSCGDLRKVCARTKGCTTNDTEGVAIGALPPAIAEAVRGAAIGQAVGPYHLAAKNAIQLVAVCSREGDGALPTRDAIRDSLFTPKLEAAARRYMRDIRRNAIVDIRKNCRI